MRRMKTDQIGNFVKLLGCLALSLLAFVANMAGEELSESFAFESPRLEKKYVGEILFDQISIIATENYSQPGQPALPVRGVNLLIPFGMEIESIKVSSEGTVSLGDGYLLEPGYCPTKLSKVDFAKSSIKFDKKIYDSDQIYPENNYKEIGVQVFRGYRMLILRLYPVRYVPARGELFYSPILNIRIGLKPAAKADNTCRYLPADIREIETRVVNTEVITTYGAESKGGEKSYDMLILTIPEYVDAFLPLKEYHDNHSLPTEIRTTVDVGSSNPDDIRDYVREVFLNSGIEYLLIGGDDEHIPAKDLFAPFMWLDYGTMEYMYDTIYDMPGDLYFGCLDGPYNFDNDDIWGEPTDGEGGGEVDLVAEVYVGRAPASTVADVGRFVAKTLKYLRTNRSSHLKNILLLGEWLGKGGVSEFAAPALQEYKDSSDANGFFTYGFPTQLYDIDELYDMDWPGQSWPVEELCERVNRSPQIITHMGHANTNYALKLYKGDIPDTFLNEDPFFLYSVGCYAGEFDGPDCWAEYLTVRSDHAAFAAVMNARFGSIAYWESTDGPSHRFGREFFDAIYNPNENKPELGRANHDSKEDNLYRLDERAMRWCYLQTNLFGDPSVAIKRGWLIINKIEFIETIGDSDGIIEAGETAQAVVTVANYQSEAVNAVDLSFSINDGAINIGNPQTSWTAIPAFDSVDNTLDRFIIEVPPGYVPRTDSLCFIISWDGCGGPDTLLMPIHVGEPSILLVDDDGGAGYEEYYKETLANLAVPFHVFNNTSSTHPDSAFLAGYNIVIWFTGDRLYNSDPFGSDFIEFTEASIIQKYLDGGGKLFLTGQHMAFQLSIFNNYFLQNYMKSEYISCNLINSLEAEPGATVFYSTDMISLTGSGGAGNLMGPDQILPTNGGNSELRYTGASSMGAVSYTGDYQLIFMPLGFETIPEIPDEGISRDVAMTRILYFFSYQRPSACPKIVAMSLTDEDMTHVIDHLPQIQWIYHDDDNDDQQMYQIQVGKDEDWTLIEMWNYGPVSGTASTDVYAGLALMDGEDYYFRLRAYDGGLWSGWHSETFHMNSAPANPPNLLPADGQTVKEDSVVLSHGNVVDGEGDGLTYDYEIYEDALMTVLVRDTSGVSQHEGDRTEWAVSPMLPAGRDYFWRARADDGYEAGEWSEPTAFHVNFLYICGDSNSDASVNVGDVVFLVNLIFHNGPPADPQVAGDVNCDGALNIGDAVYLGNYVFQPSAPVPCAACP